MLISSVWRASSRWYFSLGLLMGGACAAMIALAAGSLLLRPTLPSDFTPYLIGATFGVALLHDSRVVRLRAPQCARQVPEQIVRAGPIAGAVQFGFEMGTGMRTFMTSLLPHVALVALLLAASPVVAICMGLAFGLGRASVVVARALPRHEGSWSALYSRSERSIQLSLVITSAAAWALTAI